MSCNVIHRHSTRNFNGSWECMFLFFNCYISTDCWELYFDFNPEFHCFLNYYYFGILLLLNPCIQKFSWLHSVVMKGRTIRAKELRLDTFTSLESTELSVKPLLTVKHEMLVVQSEMQLVNICRKESEGFEAFIDWLWSCLKWFSKFSLWLYSVGFSRKIAK